MKERFLSKVIRTEGCWRWTASKTEFGYGRFNMGGKNGKIEKAHRVSYLLFVGELPKGKHVLHHCDNPECTSPKHLYLGSDKENGFDRATRNRVAHGTKSNLSKFSEELIRKIRSEIKPNTTITKEHSKKYNVSRRHLRDLINLRTRRKDGMEYLQQGDCLFFKEAAIPENFVKIEHSNVVQHGEATNHSHALYDGDFEFYQEPKTKERYLKIVEPTMLKHEEHKAFKIDPGVYRIGIVREYDHWMEESRAVID